MLDRAPGRQGQEQLRISEQLLSNETACTPPPMGWRHRNSPGYRGHNYGLGTGDYRTAPSYRVGGLAGDLQKLLLCSPLRLPSLLKVLL